MFGCAGCFGFEPHIQRWLGRKADYVNFVRIPAPWNAAAVVHARAYLHGRSARQDRGDRRRLLQRDPHQPQHARDRSQACGLLREARRRRSDVQEHVQFVRRQREAETRRGARRNAIACRARRPSSSTASTSTQGRQAGSYEAWFAIIDDLAAREHAAAERRQRGAVSAQDSGNPKNHTPNAFHAGTRCNVSVPTW